MINVTEITTSRGLEAAEKKAEQAKRQIANEKKKLNADRRKKENHLKIVAGGIIHKYLPDSFLFEEHEMDEIIKTAFACPEVQKVISDIRERASLSITKSAESEVVANESENTEIR